MNRDEHLFIKLMEECAEVQQRTSKLLQFGPNERQADHPDHKTEAPTQNNRELLQEEIYDLLSVIELLGFDSPGILRIEAKAKKIEKYRIYSEQLGRVAESAAIPPAPTKENK